MDAKSIGLQLMRRGNTEGARKHCEFVINRCGLGRGDEHLFVRWLTTSWDYFFNGVDFTWTMIKTYSDQCMLIFCDRYLYSLYPFMALAYYFMFGGLVRDNPESPVLDFIFPYLHNMSRDNVARRLPNTICQNIDVCSLDSEEGKKRIKAFTSKSIRRGTMTENCLNPELTIQHEYERSGHVLADLAVNHNAEGYIGSCPGKMPRVGLQSPGTVTHTSSRPVHV